MPAPTTVPELLDRLRRSSLVPPDRLAGFLAGLQTTGNEPATPAALLEQLVEAGMITRFHADRLAAGKYKGFQLGSYLILDQLGTGGMGQVYLAEHLTMQRLVGLKVLPVFSSDDVVARERFFREARAAATLDHPNIVRVFDLCQEGRLLYLVMEYVEGISLQGLVARLGPLDVRAACHYIRQVAFGLQHAYELGFVHRDIKPANLLLDRTGVVRILDFGLVRSDADAADGLTRRLDNKHILGTADYVAPEQAVDSSRVDIRADIYSLGATFYFLLAGRPLFPDGRTAQKLVWQQIKDPVPLTRLRPDVPPEVAEIVHTMIQKNPADRYRAPVDVFDVLAAWTEEPIAPPAESLLPKPPTRVAMSRSGVVAMSAARASGVTGSAAHVVAAAMRSGGGSSSGIRPGDSLLAPSLSAKPTPPAKQDPTSDTAAVALQVTQRTPGGLSPTDPDPPATDPAVAAIAADRQWWVMAAALLAAVGLTALGAAVLILVARG